MSNIASYWNRMLQWIFRNIIWTFRISCTLRKLEPTNPFPNGQTSIIGYFFSPLQPTLFFPVPPIFSVPFRCLCSLYLPDLLNSLGPPDSYDSHGPSDSLCPPDSLDPSDSLGPPDSLGPLDSLGPRKYPGLSILSVLSTHPVVKFSGSRPLFFSRHGHSASVRTHPTWIRTHPTFVLYRPQYSKRPQFPVRMI